MLFLEEGEDTLEGVRDYPSGVTLSNVAALLQHLMQSPTYIKSVLQRLERVSPEYCYSKSAGQNDDAFPPVRVIPIYVKQTESHIRPLTQSPLVSFCNCRTALRFKIFSCLFFLLFISLGNIVLISVKTRNVVRYAICHCYGIIGTCLQATSCR